MSHSLIRHSMLIVSGVIGLGGVASYPTVASAAEYGAMAYDVGAGRIGSSWHGASLAIANAAALNACNSAGCKIVIEIGPGLCGALATAPNPTGWGAASRGTRGDAELGAMEVCQHYNLGQCKVQASDCNQ
jgi:Domain of unknown function (DUF4189)